VVPPGDLSRDELIALVERIMRVETSDEAEEDRLIELFESSVTHPAASDLIFYPHKYFGEAFRRTSPSAKQVVDAALACRPIQLGPGT
jgi:hypothetical protein